MKVSIYEGILAALIILVLTGAPLLAGDPDDYKGDPPLNAEMPGLLYIKVLPKFAPLQIKDYDGIPYTGISSLDAIADRHGVFKIHKEFPMKEPPSNPGTPDLSRYYRVFFPDEYEPRYMMELYEGCPEIEFAEPLPVEKMLYIPNDPRYRTQWHLEHCGFPEAWNVSHGSEEIVIGIIDSGLDMDADGQYGIHEDFEENLWFNLGEDINENGVLDWDDYNDRDDDDNGYADDFYGWDFSGRDNWPDDPWGRDNGHGTHVAGIASAVTDNETGIAGAAFNTKLMIGGCYNLRNDSTMDNTNPAFYYMAENGADVINISWGHRGRSYQAQEDAVNYALDAGVIIFAACGNDTVNDREENATHFWPVAYDGVIGVGATTRNDNHASFSNYGDYTDLVAPGVSIVSAVPRDAYTAWQGTSMASPLACGLGALMLSVRPDLDRDELLEWMQRTAVDISGQNEDYPGIQYRIDADKLLNSTHPELGFEEWSFDDNQGNGNGRPEPGELVFINMTVRNEEQFMDAHSIVITLATEDESITVERGEINLDVLENGDEIEIAQDQRLSFRVARNTTPHYATFYVIFDSEEDWRDTTEIQTTIGIPYYVLIDDDGGSAFENFYMSDLDSNEIVYDTWSIEADGSPEQERLNQYDFVIWMTGSVENPLSGGKMDLISGFLDNGGSLLISGQFIGDAHGDEPFHAEYLHARHITDDSGGRQLFGSPDNPISNGVTLLIIGGGAAGNGTTSPSSMEPLEGADVLVTYGTEESPGEIGGIVYEGEDHRVVYLGFALEAVTGIRSTPRDEFVGNILSRFYELGVREKTTAPVLTDYDLRSPWPNPFNYRTSVRAFIPRSGEFVLEVLDLQGRIVETLHSGSGTSGEYSFTWTADHMPAGVYMIRLSWDEGVIIRKTALIK